MLTIFIALFILILLLKIRLKVQLSESTKSAFVGLGRTGISYNIRTKKASLYIMGRQIKEISSGKKDSQKEKSDVKQKSEKLKKDKPKRVRPVKDILALIPKSSKALFTYSVSLLKSFIVEELEGQVTAGFDSPDITGQFFGYYQAAYYAVPSVVGRLQYYPNWTEASFDANLKASVAIPLYKVVYRSIILFFSLPLRDIIKITIGRKERSHDG